MSNPCGYTAASLQDIADLLCTVQTEIDGRLATLQTSIDSLQSDIFSGSGSFPDTIDLLTLLRDRLGDPGMGTNIDAKINDIKTELDSVQTDTTTIQLTQASQNVSLAEINADVDEANDAIGVAGGGKVDIIDAVQSSGVISLVVGLADFLKSGGGSSTLDLVQWLLSLWNAPPLALLHASGSITLATNNTIAIVAGDYGYTFAFTAPAYWGRRSGVPVAYTPMIGRAAFVGPFGTVGALVEIISDTAQVYPIPVGATELQVHLEPGITGTYQILRFL